MDAGGLAGDAAGQVLTIWMRNKEIFQCVPGKAEVSLGKGEQGWAAAGPDGVYLLWILGRPGGLMMLRPGAKQPVQLAANARDPVAAGSPTGKGPVIAAWEEGRPGAMQIRAAILHGRQK
jgi:hypothetical protein